MSIVIIFFIGVVMSYTDDTTLKPIILPVGFQNVAGDPLTIKGTITNKEVNYLVTIQAGTKDELDVLMGKISMQAKTVFEEIVDSFWSTETKKLVLKDVNPHAPNPIQNAQLMETRDVQVGPKERRVSDWEDVGPAKINRDPRKINEVMTKLFKETIPPSFQAQSRLHQPPETSGQSQTPPTHQYQHIQTPAERQSLMPQSPFAQTLAGSGSGQAQITIGLASPLDATVSQMPFQQSLQAQSTVQHTSQPQTYIQQPDRSLPLPAVMRSLKPRKPPLLSTEASRRKEAAAVKELNREIQVARDALRGTNGILDPVTAGTIFDLPDQLDPLEIAARAKVLEDKLQLINTMGEIPDKKQKIKELREDIRRMTHDKAEGEAFFKQRGEEALSKFPDKYKREGQSIGDKVYRLFHDAQWRETMNQKLLRHYNELYRKKNRSQEDNEKLDALKVSDTIQCAKALGWFDATWYGGPEDTSPFILYAMILKNKSHAFPSLEPTQKEQLDLYVKNLRKLGYMELMSRQHSDDDKFIESEKDESKFIYFPQFEQSDHVIE